MELKIHAEQCDCNELPHFAAVNCSNSISKFSAQPTRLAVIVAEAASCNGARALETAFLVESAVI